MNELYRLSAAVMGTVVTIDAVWGADADDETRALTRAYLDGAMQWFHRVEACCTRFDPASELMQLARRPGTPTHVSPTLFEAARFALAVAEETEGAFDPTVGDLMARRGFDREHRTGRPVPLQHAAPTTATYRDVHLDDARQTITIDRPLTLDLGAVAKGLAVDLAARELADLRHFAINAGGDLYVAGHNLEGEAWIVGIRHPRAADEILESWRVSNLAVCTSGDYLRRVPGQADEHHIIDPRARMSARTLASVTVVAASAMVADALATAAFVLGPADGVALLERHQVHGLMVTPALERVATRGFIRDSTILPHAEGAADHRAGAGHGAGGDQSAPAAGRDRAR